VRFSFLPSSRPLALSLSRLFYLLYSLRILPSSNILARADVPRSLSTSTTTGQSRSGVSRCSKPRIRTRLRPRTRPRVTRSRTRRRTDVLDLAGGEEGLARARRDSARTRRAWGVLCPRRAPTGFRERRRRRTARGPQGRQPGGSGSRRGGARRASGCARVWGVRLGCK
jgi:hypothetical protein